MHIFIRERGNKRNIYYRYKTKQCETKNLFLFSYKDDDNLKELFDKAYNKKLKDNYDTSEDKEKEYENLVEAIKEKTGTQDYFYWNNFSCGYRIESSDRITIYEGDREVDLYEYANNFLQENYDLYLEIPILILNINKYKVGSCGELNVGYVISNGKFVPYPRHITIYWKTSVYDFESDLIHFSIDNVLDVLKHELVHYAMLMLKLPWFDKDPSFEKELKRLGVKTSKVKISKKKLKEENDKILMLTNHMDRKRIFT